MYWSAVGTGLTNIAVGAPDEVWGINTANKIVRKNPETGTWVEEQNLPGSAIPAEIECGADGTVMCRSAENEIFRYNGFNGNWVTLTGWKFQQITIGDNGHVYAIGDSSPQAIWYYRGELKCVQTQWRNMKVISVSADDTLIGIDSTSDHLCRMDDTSDDFTTLSPNTQFKDVSVASASHIMGITNDDRLLVYIGEQTFQEIPLNEKYYDAASTSWKTRKIVGDLHRVDHDQNGNCYLTVQHDNVYTSYRMIPLVTLMQSERAAQQQAVQA